MSECICTEYWNANEAKRLSNKLLTRKAVHFQNDHIVLNVPPRTS